MELNNVVDPANTAKTFENGLGTRPTGAAAAADPTYYFYGSYTPGPLHAPASGLYNNHSTNDFILSTMMVSRISNMVTLRSDTFTAYVIVQGWRNVTSQYPELVVQKRLATLIDRSALGTATGAGASQTPKLYSIPAD